MASGYDSATANSFPSQNRVHALSFNQDFTSLAMGTSNNYSFFTISPDNTINEIYNYACPDTYVIERLFSSSLIAVVSRQAPRKLRMCDFLRGTEILSYSFTNTILSVKLNQVRLIVCLEQSIYIHNMRDMKLLHTILETPPNHDGLCALSSNKDNPHFAYPGSAITGEIQIFDTINLKYGVIIGAHDSPLVSMAFDMTGTRIATASNKGTVIRIHSAVDGSRLFEFRRGVRRIATIHSLAFSSDSIYLAASSNTETIHVFRLIHPNEKPPEASSSLMNSVGRVLGGITYYLPRRTSDVLTQYRAFATVHLESAGTKTVIAMNSCDNILKLYVVGYNGVLSIYEVNTQQGGECKLIAQHVLFNISQTAINVQTVTTNNERHSIDGSRQLSPRDKVRFENQSVSGSLELTNEKQSEDELYVTTVEEKTLPPLPSLP